MVYTPGIRIPIGDYDVRVSNRGFVPQEFLYTVRYGNNLHSVELARDYGVLSLSVTPPDAEVLIIWPDQGRTFRKPYTEGMRVPVGPVEVRARFMGYRTTSQTFDMTSGGYRSRVSLTLIDATAGQQLRDPLKVGGQGPVMVVIPSGTFTMGNNAGPLSERPERTVSITQPFAMGRFEVSVAEYQVYASSTGRALPDKLDPTDASLPMRNLDWDAAASYAGWLTEQAGARYRLPTEAEWEYVARAGTRTRFSFGNDETAICEHGNVADKSTKTIFREWRVVDCDDGFSRLAPTGSFAPNPFGVHDMHGNVAEWVMDCSMAEYSDAPTDGTAATEGLDCQGRGYRGGSWDSTPAEAVVTYRNAAVIPNDDRGFRLVREL